MKVDESYKLKGSVYSDGIPGKDGAVKSGSSIQSISPTDPRALAFAQMMEGKGNVGASGSFYDFLNEDKENKLEKILNALSDKAAPRQPASQLNHSQELQARLDSYTSDINSRKGSDSAQNDFTAQTPNTAAINGLSDFGRQIAPAVDAQNPGQVTSPDDVLRIADSVVERILVSDPRHSANSQVTITFNSSSALPQTDITLRRDLDGLLSIIVSANNPKSFNRLVEAREQIIEGVQKYEDREVRFILNGANEHMAQNHSKGDDDDIYGRV